jgi:hypothetical protein
LVSYVYEILRDIVKPTSGLKGNCSMVDPSKEEEFRGKKVIPVELIRKI